MLPEKKPQRAARVQSCHSDTAGDWTAARTIPRPRQPSGEPPQQNLVSGASASTKHKPSPTLKDRHSLPK